MGAHTGSSTNNVRQNQQEKRGEGRVEKQSLSKRQQETYELIVRSLRERGIPPSRPELSRGLGTKGLAGVDQFLAALARKGWIELLPATQRGIRVISAGELPLIGETLPTGEAWERNGRIVDRVPGTLADQVHPRPDYFVECHTDSLQGLGVRRGDLLAIQTATDAENGSIVAVRWSRARNLKFGRFERIDERHAELRPVTEGEAATRLGRTKQEWSIAGLVVGTIKVRPINMWSGQEDTGEA